MNGTQMRSLAALRKKVDATPTGRVRPTPAQMKALQAAVDKYKSRLTPEQLAHCKRIGLM